MQTNNILILINNIFASKKKVIIKVVRIMTKHYKYLTFAQSIKFNKTQIKFDKDDIVLIKKSYINDIFLVIDHNIDSTGLKNIIRTKLLLKKQYMTQKA